MDIDTIGNNRRRRSDRRTSGDRRQTGDTRGAWLEPSWSEQRLQFIIRYVFAFLGLVYFNFVFSYKPEWFSLTQINIYLASYTVWITLTWMHARYQPYSMPRFRIAMWVDIVCASIAVVNDPFDVPLTTLVYIVIVLGNGMRYGIRCFSEALLGGLLAAMLSLTLRYSGTIQEVSSGVVFLNVFGAIILVYSYILMTRVEASRRNLEKSSRLDPLTGLMNRGALFDRAAGLLKHIADNQDTAVVMFADLDRFKEINDTYGHAEGDRVLCAFAAILKNCIRASDIVSRYGGDEFVLLLPYTSLAEGEMVGRRIQSELQTWATENKYMLNVTIGMGEAPRHGLDLTSLLACVDRALYKSKTLNGMGGLCSVVVEP